MSIGKRGLFWLINNELLSFPFDKNTKYSIAKSGKTFNHKLLWEYVRPKAGKPYNYYPRGRVEIESHGRSVIYMSPHIGSEHIPEIMGAFSLLGEPRVIIDGSRHYRSHLDHRR